jgi:adenylate cyclase class IV
MARNIEIKARIQSIELLLPAVASLADSGPITIHQEDTFFSCRNGRMKLRKFSDAEGELIFYQRPDHPGPKESFYFRAPTTSPDALRDALAFGYGVIGQVRKCRILFMTGRTRIHLDRVERLGDFLELEVIMAENELLEAATLIAQRILDKLDVLPEQLVPAAYLDLLAKTP